MEVFRISRKKYSRKLTASGVPNRWNKRDEDVLYTGSSRSLASLELVVHKSSIEPADEYRVMIISIADEDHLKKQMKIGELPKNWRSTLAYPQLQIIGSKWYNSQETLIMKVPSAVIPQEYNYLINVNHPEFKNKVSLIRSEEYFWDVRLF